MRPSRAQKPRSPKGLRGWLNNSTSQTGDRSESYHCEWLEQSTLCRSLSHRGSTLWNLSVPLVSPPQGLTLEQGCCLRLRSCVFRVGLHELNGSPQRSSSPSSRSQDLS